MTSPLTDPDNEPELLDVAEHGDAMDDPQYRRLLGLDELEPPNPGR